jgi:Protein of unknown function (DUF1579)
MIARRAPSRIAQLGCIFVACAMAASAGAQSRPGAPSAGGAEKAPPPPPSAMQRMLEPGAQAAQLARQVGTWDVAMTFRPSPDAKPIVVRGMVAERTMVGLYLQEIMKPKAGSNLPDFRRIDYLTYDKMQARWEYASMDTRAPIGIMSAAGLSDQPGADITVYFDGFATPGMGQELEGRFVRARHVDTLENDHHAFKRQFWTQPGHKEWLAVQYQYTRLTSSPPSR